MSNKTQEDISKLIIQRRQLFIGRTLGVLAMPDCYARGWLQLAGMWRPYHAMW